MFKSVRARLAFSFGAIALLVAISLGLVLMWILQDYYCRLEQDYLDSNADTIALSVRDLLMGEPPQAMRESQLQNLAFLSQTRVRLFDAGQQVIADSGLVEENQVAIGVIKSDTVGLPSTDDLAFSIKGTPGISDEGEMVVMYVQRIDAIDGEVTISKSGSPDEATGVSAVEARPTAERVEIVSSMSARGTGFGFQLGDGGAVSAQRSSESATRVVRGGTGEVLGYVQLSDGPAYGQEILDNVRRGWISASLFAVLLACGVGLVISQRISAPVQALTVAAGQMSAGNLSARVTYEAKDELGTLAKTFNVMGARLEDTIAALRRFVMDAAHELQTPLTALRTNLEMALEEGLEEKRSSYLSQALDQVTRLSRLTGGLLDLSRLESGGWEEQVAAVDLVALVQEVCEPFAARAEQAGQTLTLELTAELPPVMGDAQKLRSALSNLLDNALKFTPEGGTVCVRCGLDGGEVFLEVRDSGIGLPEKEEELVFNRFYRGRNAAMYPGSGLGLAVVEAVARAHGGRVEAGNNPQGGACFRVVLPRMDGGVG